ncbi:MAG: YggS family pyridoxal phosphate-dependent enzyme [Endomicrobiales bacterium]|nr:YggS family pyridoxal phosphate-dependent enzyme [Endomicrobiales bacterium]
MNEQKIKLINQRISESAAKSGRPAEDITLVAVTKTVPPEEIARAVASGVRDIGENKVQEAMKKFDAMGESLKGVKKHYIGHLQTNKAKKAVEIFDVIQSLDSIPLAEEIQKHAAGIGKIQDCLVEVKVSDEEAKYGLAPEGLGEFVEKAARFGNIRLAGLMTMAPFFEDPEKTRPYFKRAREAFEKIKAGNGGFRFLSMGMSNDFTVAIEEGANMVRIGTAIFG